jgi:hypothetical protein
LKTFTPRSRRPNCVSVSAVIAALVLVAGCSGGSSGGGGGNANANGGGGIPPATASLTASDTLIDSARSVVLTWSSNNADSCTASGGWNGSKALSGSQTVGPIGQDTTFTLSCSGSGGGGIGQVTVRIADNGATVNLNADPLYVLAGDSSTLTWDSSGTDSCTASGGWSGTRNTSGTFTTPPINATTTYRLSCSGPDGTGVSMVTVEVVDKTLRWQAPTQNVDGSDLTDLAGFVIYWDTTSRGYASGGGGSFVINSPSTTEWEVTAAPGTYYFAMTAFDADNNESAYSNEVLKVIPR